MGTSRLPLVLGLAATALLAGLWWVLTAGAGSDPAAEDHPAGVLSPADRDALDAPPVDAGVAADGPDPAVDFTDPEAVARAYVVAGYSLRDTDAGHTNRRAVRYAAPATPPSSVGVLVVDPPPLGHAVSAEITEVTQVGGEPTDTRRGYLVGYRAVVRPGRAVHDLPARSRYLLLARQFDGRWLVAGDSPDAQVGEP